MNTPSRTRSVLNVLLIEGLVNLIVMAAKFFIGSITGSAAIIGDALHSLSDLANNIIAYLSVKISTQPPDKDHQYGHHKFEHLAVFILATLLMVVAFEIIMSSIERFGKPVEQSLLGLILMIVVLLLNISVTLWERHQSKKLNSTILRADASHTLGDVLTTVAVIIGWQLSLIGYPWVDSLMAVVIACMVMYLAYDLFKRAIPILVDEVGANTEAMINAVRTVPGVCEVKRLRSRVIGDTIAADMVITVDGRLTTLASHEVADRVEHVLAEKFGANDVTVHIEPV